MSTTNNEKQIINKRLPRQRKRQSKIRNFFKWRNKPSKTRLVIVRRILERLLLEIEDKYTLYDNFFESRIKHLEELLRRQVKETNRIEKEYFDKDKKREANIKKEEADLVKEKSEFKKKNIILDESISECESAKYMYLQASQQLAVSKSQIVLADGILRRLKKKK